MRLDLSDTAFNTIVMLLLKAQAEVQLWLSQLPKDRPIAQSELEAYLEAIRSTFVELGYNHT